MASLQHRAWTLLHENLLHRLLITSTFWDLCSSLQDILTDRTPGFWFGSHPANQMACSFWAHRLLENARDSLFTKDNTPIRNQCAHFLDKCEELQGILYTLLQTCSGGPGRATEIVNLLVYNTSTAVRNLFISGGQLFTVTCYHKGRALSDGRCKPIARFPDSVTARILLVYLIVVRPLECHHVTAVSGRHHQSVRQTLPKCQ